MPKNDYKADLLTRLKDPEYAAGYLTAARAESSETFLLALQDVAQAQKGMTKVASEAGVNRENLYRMLSEEGNPRLSSFDAVLDALGFEYEIVVKGKRHPVDVPSAAAQGLNNPTEELARLDLEKQALLGLIDESSRIMRGLWTQDADKFTGPELRTMGCGSVSVFASSAVEHHRDYLSRSYVGIATNIQYEKSLRDLLDILLAPSVGIESSNQFTYEQCQLSTEVAFKKEGVFPVWQRTRQSQRQLKVK